ncbi:kinase-like domain-containing protein [Melampsora americana]|nr:kinase-like domain-containing protein [Melampsora americana]
MSNSTSSSSSSLLNIWSRGIPSDQLTPKASAQAGTSTEIDPFDSHSSSFQFLHNKSSNRNLQQQQQQQQHSRKSSLASQINPSTESSIHSKLIDDGFKTPMPSSSNQYFDHPNINPTDLSHQSTSISHPNQSIITQSNSQGLATSALKAIAQQVPLRSSPSPSTSTPITDFSFTANPINRAKNALRGTISTNSTKSNPLSNVSSSDLKMNSDVHNQSMNTSHPNQKKSEIQSNSPMKDDLKIDENKSQEPNTIMNDNKNLIEAISNMNLETQSEEIDSKSTLPNRSLTTSPTTISDSSTHALAKPPKGLLSVKIVSARSLVCSSSRSRPYVVAQFDNNEFVSREPIDEDEDESKGNVSSPQTRPNGPSHNPTKSIDVILYNQTRPKSDSTIGTDGKGPPVGSGSSSLEEDLQKTPVISNGNGLICLSGQNPIWKQELDFDVAEHEHLNLSHRTLHISVYDRSIGDTINVTGTEESSNNLINPGIEGLELFLGETEIEINFNQLVKNNGWFDQWYKLGTQNAECTGEIRLKLKYKEHSSKKSLSVEDFEFLKMIGKGTFGRVFQVRKKDTKRIYAMKVLSKKEVIDKKEVEHTIGERNILQQSNDCPFLLGLKFSFQSPGELFLVMDYKSGGELFHHLQKEGRFTEERARFYTAEIVLALEHLHSYNIVYRDLKPENILLDATGHIVLCDFGLSKPNLTSDQLTTTFCGTTEYLAPEVLLDDHGYSKLVDFWSLGVLLFEMCCGWSPFYAEDNQQMYKNICFGKIKFPRGVIGDDGKQFVKGLLNRNPKHRLGSQNDAKDLKSHSFFKSIDWELLSLRQIIPSFKPYIDSDESVSNFDDQFTKLDLKNEIQDFVMFDENDRSDDWLKQTTSNSSFHNSKLINSAAYLTGNGTNSGTGNKVKPIEISEKSKRKSQESLQDHFRGSVFFLF